MQASERFSRLGEDGSQADRRSQAGRSAPLQALLTAERGNEDTLVQEHKLSAYRAMPVSRATENGIYLVMANAPADPQNMHGASWSHGNSNIVHPNGTVLSEAGFFQETLVSASIDLKAADRRWAKRSVDEGVIVSDWLRQGSQLVEASSS